MLKEFCAQFILKSLSQTGDNASVRCFNPFSSIWLPRLLSEIKKNLGNVKRAYTYFCRTFFVARNVSNETVFQPLTDKSILTISVFLKQISSEEAANCLLLHFLATFMLQMYRCISKTKKTETVKRGNNFCNQARLFFLHLILQHILFSQIHC